MNSRERWDAAWTWAEENVPDRPQRHVAATALSLRLSTGEWPTPEEVRRRVKISWAPR